jgi:hypothetical protein
MTQPTGTAEPLKVPAWHCREVQKPMCRQPLAGEARADQKSALSCRPHRSCFLSAENVFRDAIPIVNLPATKPRKKTQNVQPTCSDAADVA